MKSTGFSICFGVLVTAYSVQSQTQFFRIIGPVPTAFTACSNDGLITWTNVPTNSVFTVQTSHLLPGTTNWVDYVRVPVTNAITTHRLFDLNPPDKMVFIPAGVFTMGDFLNDMIIGDTPLNEHPVHDVYVSAFYMDKFEVTKTLWDEVRTWAMFHDYNLPSGSAAGTNHPVNTISWYTMIQWCNARSEKEGLTPAYYTDSYQTNVYRKGQIDLLNDCVNWHSGYRLPTEAEWEKAARGGANGRRFPWSETVTISHSQANYNATNRYAYDISPTWGYHPDYSDGTTISTSPVSSFPANQYGLYDMAGNVWEQCWDWFDQYYYHSSAAQDPRGSLTPAMYNLRTLRGGAMYSWAYRVRCSSRGNTPMNVSSTSVGFRCVRGL